MADASLKPLCRQCGSERIIPRAHLLDRSANSTLELTLEVYRNPNAFFFKGGKATTVYARVCADCGNVELFVENGEALWQAMEFSQREDEDAPPTDTLPLPDEPNLP